MRLKFVGVVLCAVSLVAGGGLLDPSPAGAVNAKTALLYGDSLMYESQWKLNSDFALQPGWTQVAHNFPGFALCDWVSRLAADIADVHPSVVAVETAGNYTRPCMLDGNGVPLAQGSEAFYAKYRADMHAFFSTATASGAAVVFIVAPPMLSATWNTAVLGLQKIAREVAASYPGVSVSTLPRNSVSAAGIYVATKPCLPSETALAGCVSGQIGIRTNVGTQLGIHFCLPGLPTVYPYLCPEYSSGEFRFGGAVVSTAVTPPAPIRPTVRMQSVSGAEGAPLTFRPSLLWPYSQDLTLCYSTADGTATVAANDYTAVTGCFTIPAWTTAGPTIPVSTAIDAVNEASESFVLKISGQTVPITANTKTVKGVINTNVT